MRPGHCGALWVALACAAAITGPDDKPIRQGRSARTSLHPRQFQPTGAGAVEECGIPDLRRYLLIGDCIPPGRLLRGVGVWG